MTDYANHAREQGRIQAMLDVINLILRYKPIDIGYMGALLWFRTRLERNLEQ